MKAEKKNICITINSLGRGGAEKQCLLLAKALKPYYTTTIVILNPGDVYPPRVIFINEAKLNHVFLAKNPIKKFFEFKRFLRKGHIDIIFSFLPTDTLFSAICGRLAGVPFIFGGIRNSYMAKPKFIALRLANNYLLNYTIANNFAAYRSAIAFGFKEKVFVISNGIDIRPFVEKKEIIVKTINIISLGRLVRQKEYEIALKSIARLKEILGVGYTFRYSIVGQGPERGAIESAINTHGLQDIAKIITDASDIYAMLEKADIYLCSSSFEGVSNAILEAMNCSLPLVVTDAGDNSLLVLHEKNGFVVSIHDYEALAQSLKKLVNSYELRVRMGTASHAHLVENFSYQAFQKNYLNLIENIETLRTRDGKVHYSETNVS